jgi:hypothetical protein
MSFVKWVCLSFVLAAALFTPAVVGHNSTVTTAKILADGGSPPPPPPWPKPISTGLYLS